MINIISLGAGKQSSYMLLQALEGRFKEKPDLAIISDTGCEPKYVYSYLMWLKSYVKLKYNFDIITVSSGNIYRDTLDYIAGLRTRVASLPLRLEGDGLIFRQCTAEYKLNPLRKYIKENFAGYNIRLWIGISLDEMERMKKSTIKTIYHYYPLVENRIGIDSIVEWFDKNDWPVPGKSACLIYPFHSDSYWRRFKKEFPDEFEMACLFDDAIRDYPKLNKKAYLSRHLKPLREIDFSFHQSLFPELIEECDGLCGL